MIVAIHQPNFFPWVGYFDKISRCDYFVFLDDVQYSKGTMTNRTYIKNNNTISYLTCPVSYHHPAQINEVKISDNPWKEKAIRTINSNYHKNSIYRDKIKDMIFREEKSLSVYNIQNIIDTCKLIEISPRISFIVQSDMRKITNRNLKGTRLIQDIVTHLGGTIYYSGIGGKSYLNKQEFDNSGIQITYQKTTSFPKTSIIDVLLTYSIDEIKSGLLT